MTAGARGVARHRVSARSETIIVHPPRQALLRISQHAGVEKAICSTAAAGNNPRE